MGTPFGRSSSGVARATSTPRGDDRGRDAHWTEIARRWEHVGPPLRPSAEDVADYAEIVASRARAFGTPRALLLGVTPEIARLPWPAGTSLLAVDHNESMIRGVWPGTGAAPGVRSVVVRAEWTSLPLRHASRDLAFCDGGLHLLAHPGGQSALVRSLGEVLVPGGLLVLRLFLPRERREVPDAVLRDLAAGRIPSVHVLKLRLAMALQDDVGTGVRLGDVRAAVDRVAADPASLAARTGWLLAEVRALDTYRDCDTRYAFPTLDEARRLFCEEPGGFALESVRRPARDPGVRCPIVVLRRR